MSSSVLVCAVKACMEIQTSEESTSGYALRVPKGVRFKLGKNVDDVDTSEKITQLYESQYERQRDATTVT